MMYVTYNKDHVHH